MLKKKYSLIQFAKKQYESTEVKFHRINATFFYIKKKKKVRVFEFERRTIDQETI